MTETPLWKSFLVWGLVALGLIFAAPNLFYDRVEKHNDAAAAITAAGGTATADQAADRALWPDWMPSAIVPLGLDLRGGAHLLAEVKVADVYKSRIDALWPEVRDALRDVRDQVGNVRRLPSVDGVLRVGVSNPEGMAVALEKVRALASPVVTLTGIGSTDLDVTAEGSDIVVQLSEAERSVYEINARAIVNANIGIKSSSGDWKVQIWGKNIFNKYYWTSTIRAYDVVIRYPARPAEYGVTLSHRF